MPVIRDPLAVVPVLPPALDIRRDERGNAHLRLPVRLTGWRKKMADRFGLDPSRKVELDEYGTLFCGMVDGRRTIRDIVDGMASKLKRDRREMERSVMLFTKSLMTKNMIALQVTPESRAERQ